MAIEDRLAEIEALRDQCFDENPIQKAIGLGATVGSSVPRLVAALRVAVERISNHDEDYIEILQRIKATLKGEGHAN